MKVNVSGHGVINFPDTMSDQEVRAVLKQFEPKKDEVTPRLLANIEKMLANQKPQIIKENSVQVVEVERVIERPTVQIVEIIKEVIKPEKQKSWRFTVKKDDDGITEVIAEPYK